MRKIILCFTTFLISCLCAYAGADWNSVAGLTPTEKVRPSGVSNGIYYGADGTSVTLVPTRPARQSPPSVCSSWET